MTEISSIISKLKKFEQLRNEIIKVSDTKTPKFAVSDCPIRHDHYSLSESLFGVGKWGWECKLCGESFTE